MCLCFFHREAFEPMMESGELVVRYRARRTYSRRTTEATREFPLSLPLHVPKKYDTLCLPVPALTDPKAVRDASISSMPKQVSVPQDNSSSTHALGSDPAVQMKDIFGFQ